MPRKPRPAGRLATDFGPLVPIDGSRVKAALRWRGLSNNRASQLSNNVVVQAAGAPRFAELSSQLLDKITNGKQPSTRKGYREALAKIIGHPITAEYLGGEEELRLPAKIVSVGNVFMSYPSRPAYADHDMLGLVDARTMSPRHPERSQAGIPPGYELEAHRLFLDVRKAWKRDSELGPLPDNLFSAIRELLSLSSWQAAAHRDSKMESESRLRADAVAFAEHMAATIRFALSPWLRGTAHLRDGVAQGLISILVSRVEFQQKAFVEESQLDVDALIADANRNNVVQHNRRMKSNAKRAVASANGRKKPKRLKKKL